MYLCKWKKSVSIHPMGYRSAIEVVPFLSLLGFYATLEPMNFDLRNFAGISVRKVQIHSSDESRVPMVCFYLRILER